MSGQSFSGKINMVSVLQTICGLFLTGVVADLEGKALPIRVLYSNKSTLRFFSLFYTLTPREKNI
jgi:hypothetical protein